VAGTAFTDIYPEGSGPGGYGPAAAELAASSGLNLEYPGMPVGAQPIHRDITLSAATPAAGTIIWTPSAPNRRLVLASAFVSSGGAGRVAIVDDQDIQGNRPVDQEIAAQGGSSPNLVPVPYPCKTPGASLKVVSTVVGTVHVRVSGWEQPG
jgi:hypothetical protein